MTYKKLEHICSSCSTQFIVIVSQDDFSLIQSCPICQTDIFTDSDLKIDLSEEDFEE